MDKRSTVLIVVLIAALAVGGYYHREKLVGYARPVLSLAGLVEHETETAETEEVAMGGNEVSESSASQSGPEAPGTDTGPGGTAGPEPLPEPSSAAETEPGGGTEPPEPLPDTGPRSSAADTETGAVGGETSTSGTVGNEPGTPGDTEPEPTQVASKSDGPEQSRESSGEESAEKQSEERGETDAAGNGREAEPSEAPAAEQEKDEKTAEKEEAPASGTEDKKETEANGESSAAEEVTGAGEDESESEKEKSEVPGETVDGPSGSGEQISYSEVGRFPVSDPPEGYREAREHFQAGNHAEAEEVLKRLVKQYPKSANVNFMLGVIYFDRGEFDLARPFFEKSARQDHDPQIRAWSREYLDRIDRE